MSISANENKKGIRLSNTKVVEVLELTSGKRHAWVIIEIVTTTGLKRIRVRKPINSIPKELL